MRKFAVLWSGQVVSLLGSGLTNFALAVWVYQRTGSVSQYALILLFAFVPGIVISPVAGTVADRFSRRNVLLLCDGAGIACMGSLAGAYAAGVLSPWEIYITTAVASVSAAFQVPAFAASVTLLVPKKDIDRANGLVMLAQAGQLIAPLLAGFMLTTITLNGVILADAASFVVNSVALLIVRIPRLRLGDRDTAADDTVLAGWLTGWRYITERPSLRSLIAFYTVLTLCVGFVDVLLTPLVLGFASPRGLGLVLTVGGTGLAAGSLLVAAWGGPRRRIHGVLGFSLPLGLALCLGSIRPNVGLVAVAAFAFLFCSAIINASVRTIWQVKVEAGLQGRVLALFNMIANAGSAIAYAAAGPITARWFVPLLRRDGSLADSFGRLMGTGSQRGMALFVLILGVIIIVAAVGGYLLPSLRRLDEIVPDAISDNEPAEAAVRQIPAKPAARTRPRLVFRLGSAFGAAAVSVVLLGALAFGVGPVPPLGSDLDPGHGVWTAAAASIQAHSQSLDVPGLEHPVTVSFTAQGVPSIQAADDADLYLAQGYVEASYRLSEMDLDRRLGEGRLAQLAGASGVASDQFELRLGLVRTAEKEWAQTPRSSPAGQELLAYSRGVNDDIAQARATGTWPALFTLQGAYPAAWTPVDSLVIQEVLTQELDFTTAPLDYALLERSLGVATTMAWFPVDPVDEQSPYDPGPYQYSGVTPVAPDLAGSAVGGTTISGGSSSGGAAASDAVTTGTADAAESLLAEVNSLPQGQVHEYPDSNAWAASGPAVSGGGAMLAGDPHLPLTLPSVWYEVGLSDPDLAVSGVSLPGLPGIVIGHNAHIAWSLTDVQNQSTLFYAEKMSKAHPDEYYWDGQWRRMQQVHYTIDVHGGAPVQLTVDLTVHGPIMTQAGQTMAVDWMGNVPSPDVAVMSNLSRADNFAQFQSALATWKAPTQNFVYADDAGNIGAISAGYYPQVAHGQPWLPLPGTGADDVTGVIPYANVPQVYDPPGHVIATANQRPAGSAYPYYIGTSMDFFDPGYRADEIYAYLRSHPATSTTGFAELQTSVTDLLAGKIMPSLLAALRDDPALNATERAALKQLDGWNDAMQASSAAAAIWNTFWSDYLSAVFQPWWKATHVPVAKDSGGLEVMAGQTSLDEDLEEWTVADPGNPAFDLPNGTVRTAPQVMRSVFGTVVAQLSAKLGGSPATWTWGGLHSTQITSLTGTAALSSGAQPSSGDEWTVNAADGYPVSTAGPSWRMIVRWNAPGQPVAEGIYPGGQSENPASPWYSDLVSDWRAGRYLPMPSVNGSSAGPVRWSLRPGG